MNDQQPTDARREMAFRRLLLQGQDLAGRIHTREEATRFVVDVAGIANISPSQLAGSIGVAPQTVNRWIRNKASPRVGQLKKLLGLLEGWLPKSGGSVKPSDICMPGDPVPGRWQAVFAGQHHDRDFPESIGGLGIHFLDTILSLEVEARDVWIIKCGLLREAERGSIGEAVMQGLKNGTNFHYVFLAGSAAEQSFVRRLAAWVEGENFAGKLTGYAIEDPIRAGRLGLTEMPGAWIAIEYSDSQAQRLRRRFDVFKALSVREYADSTRQRVKNEDGLPCWIELATPQASTWLEGLSALRVATERHGEEQGLKIIRVNARQPRREKR